MTHPTATAAPNPAVALPTLQLTSGAGGTQEPQLSMRAAAAFLGMRDYQLKKLVDAGFVPNLFRATIAPLFGAQFVSTADGVLPVAQTGVAAIDGRWRALSGASPTMTDDEFIDAARGDWTATPVGACLKAGVLGVGLGDWIVGAVLIRSVDPTPKPDPKTTRFDAELLARLDGPLGTGSIRYGSTTTPAQRGWAADFLGRRFVAKRGGSVTLI